MASGAGNSGDDMVVGRTNKSDERTILVAQTGAANGYAEDFVLSVSIVGDYVITSVPEDKGHPLYGASHGVDAIHAKGTITFPGGGQPAGNGVVGQGLNGIVGYVHPATRDTAAEGNAHAGVLGIGTASDAGVLGRGLSGVVGYEQDTARDGGFEEQEKAGVVGVGPIGVSGKSDDGVGVHGVGSTGVLGASTAEGAGIHGQSEKAWGAVFESKVRAQVRLIPHHVPSGDPAKFPGKCSPGELLVLSSRDLRGKEVASLWFCKSGDVAATADWVQLA